MKYKSGYKYILAEQTMFLTKVTPTTMIGIGSYITLTPDGLLILGKGYAWNGMTCWPDTKKNMKAGLVHDALYQLIQEGLLAMSWKNAADLTLLEMLKAEDDITANLCFFAVQELGSYFIKYPDTVLEV